MLGIGDTSWKWMLASSAVPSFLWILARASLPESPRWLLSQGRESEAMAILKKLGDNVVMSNDEDEEEVQKKPVFSDIFKNGNGKWVFFVAAFWSLQVLPTFGIGTYLPTIVEKLGFAEGNIQYLGSAIMNVFYLLGLIPIFFLMDRWGRKPTLLWAFLVSGLALLILAITTGMSHQCNYIGKLLAINLSEDVSDDRDALFLSHPMIVSMRGQIVQLVELIQQELSHNPDSQSIRYLYNYLYSKLIENCAAPSIRFIGEHYDLPITVNQLAEMESYNVTYYNDWFKQQTGVSPSLYLRRVRIDRAKELLVETSFSVMEIAVMQKYFAFKQRNLAR